MTGRAWVIIAGAVAVGLAGCGGGSSGGGSISSQPLAGTINGAPWTFVAGQTDFFLSSNGDHFFATLYDVPITTACSVSDPPGAKNFLILEIPKMTGNYAQGGTFVYPDPSTGRPYNDISLGGAVEVTAISATEIMGGVKIALDAKNSVDGQFTINVCQQ
jgi:hypothetical protein